MDLTSPTTKRITIARNKLITENLRPTPLPFPITDEYPIVLSPRKHQYSFCFENKGQVVAHANLWPRKVVCPNNKTVCKIGLIGNVATHSQFQGRGIMRELFHELELKANQQDLDGLMLWSDLVSFYHKLGFESFGNEVRFQIHHNPYSYPKKQFSCLDASTLSNHDLERILKLRPQVPYTVMRSTNEGSKCVIPL